MVMLKSRMGSKLVGLGWFLAGLVVLSGCGTDRPGRSASAQHGKSGQPSVERISMLATPVAFGGGSTVGVNGVAAKIFAAAAEDKKTRPIREGTVDFLLFDGILKELPPGGAGGRHIWTFAAKELEPLKISTAIGAAYLFALAWGSDVPAGDTITLVARYHPLEGPVIYSQPCYLSLGH